MFLFMEISLERLLPALSLEHEELRRSIILKEPVS